MGIILVSEGGLLNNRFVRESPSVIDSFYDSAVEDKPAIGGDPGDNYENDDFTEAYKYVRNRSPISVTNTDGLAPAVTYDDTVLYSGVAALGRFGVNTISGAGVVGKTGSSTADQVTVWVGSGNQIRSRTPTFDSSGNMILPGNLSITGGNFDVDGGFSAATVAKTANYTATAADYLITCDASGGAVIITLPDASLSAGKLFRIKKTDSSGNAVTIAAAG